MTSNFVKNTLILAALSASSLFVNLFPAMALSSSQCFQNLAYIRDNSGANMSSNWYNFLAAHPECNETARQMLQRSHQNIDNSVNGGSGSGDAQSRCEAQYRRVWNKYTRTCSIE
jgi:hypothetical protein